eukprot:m.142810 g.142810  ORF g.142810 m.142810 type:complete len:53 (+) comp14070_c2_seq2:829-987(+)
MHTTCNKQAKLLGGLFLFGMCVFVCVCGVSQNNIVRLQISVLLSDTSKYCLR